MKEYSTVDLSLPIIDGGVCGLSAKIEVTTHQARGKALAERVGISLEDLGGRTCNLEEFSYLTCHTGTHLDAPWHYGEIAEGKRALSIDEIPVEWCFGDGVWLDLSWKNWGERITDQDIQKELKSIGYILKPKDIVLIKTGASAYYYEVGCEKKQAGMSREATLWLGDQGIRVVGIDAASWDRPNETMIAEIKQGVKVSFEEAHRAAGERGMCIIEWLTNLDLLPHFGFLIYALPIKVQGCSAGWVRAVAFVPQRAEIR